MLVYGNFILQLYAVIEFEKEKGVEKISERGYESYNIIWSRNFYVEYYYHNSKIFKQFIDKKIKFLNEAFYRSNMGRSSLQNISYDKKWIYQDNSKQKKLYAKSVQSGESMTMSNMHGTKKKGDINRGKPLRWRNSSDLKLLNPLENYNCWFVFFSHCQRSCSIVRNVIIADILFIDKYLPLSVVESSSSPEISVFNKIFGNIIEVGEAVAGVSILVLSKELLVGPL
ncbi:hypothetical protein FF38_13361 [Lucilia cuprina]|uniref:Uncharacterized protein n=1 Tax=Lucilia cuprina TaxID=7375 RepID=A0A0L0BW57_LUCCU|nr:hypothetical protein FF38_13361 [Lucilia cuprina]